MKDSDRVVIEKFYKRRYAMQDINLSQFVVRYHVQGNFLGCELRLGSQKKFETFFGMAKRSPLDKNNQSVAEAISLTRALEAARGYW